MKTIIGVIAFAAVVVSIGASNGNDPYATVSQAERDLLKPQIERWIRDWVKHDWPDLWEIQDQTPELKDELLLGYKTAPDMNREAFVEAMRNTIGIGYPEIKAFTLTEVDKEPTGFQVVGCAKLQREAWKQTSVQYIHVRINDGKLLFGFLDSSPEKCTL